MSAQSEALRLADRLEGRWALHPEMQEVAAELRRLQARLAASEDQAERAVAGCERLRAQRDALLEALQFIAVTNPVDAALDPQRAVRVANAAIKAVEGNT